jgi:hypothetical protein
LFRISSIPHRLCFVDNPAESVWVPHLPDDGLVESAALETPTMYRSRRAGIEVQQQLAVVHSSGSGDPRLSHRMQASVGS